MAAIFTLLFIVFMSLMVNRIATVALIFTGLSRDAARFQARSAFTGAGFTTSESELIVQHPVRRKIVMLLMFLGNAGLITVIATLMVGFLTVETEVRPAPAESAAEPPDSAAEPGGEIAEGEIEEAVAPAQSLYDNHLGRTSSQRLVSRIMVLLLGLILLWIASGSKWVDRRLFKIISWALVTFTKLESHDYHGILHLSEGFTVTELEVGTEHWVTGRKLVDLRLSGEGIQVLGVLRSDKSYVGSPTGRTYIRNGDRLILYGKGEHVGKLKFRLKGEEGDAEHAHRSEEYLGERADERSDERTEERVD